MEFALNCPGQFLASHYTELGTKFMMGGTELTPAEVFSPKGFLPLLMFYAVPRMRNWFQIDLESNIHFTDVEDGYFRKEVSMPSGFLEMYPEFKYVVRQVSVDSLFNGNPPQFGMEVRLDNVFDYFNASPAERENKSWKPRHL